MVWKRFIKHWISLLLLIQFHQTSSTRSSETVNVTTKVEEPREEKCLKYDYQIHEALASTKPPFDNYFNISSAIYPSDDIFSKLVNIWVHFTNSSVNLTEVNQLTFIWSRSCLYVSDRYLSLQAMSLYSLGTIWPDRRQEDLHITIYEFCDPRETRRKLLKFLSTLDDIAIRPSQFNPTLNNVECVVDGGYKHNFKNINKAFPYICWLILCSSLIGSIFISMSFLQYCKEIYCKPADHPLLKRVDQSKIKSMLLIIFVVFWLGIILAITATTHAMQGQLTYPLIYIFVICLVCFGRFFYCLHQKHIKRRKCRIVLWKFQSTSNDGPGWGFLCTAYPGCFIAVHHILWVMIGIITEPFWAIPVITSYIMVAFLFYVLSSLYYSFEEWHPRQTINFVLLITGAISVVIVQFSFLLVGHLFFDNSFMSSAIQTALVVIITIWFKSSKGEKDTTGDSTVGCPSETEDNRVIKSENVKFSDV